MPRILFEAFQGEDPLKTMLTSDISVHNIFKKLTIACYHEFQLFSIVFDYVFNACMGTTTNILCFNTFIRKNVTNYKLYYDYE